MPTLGPTEAEEVEAALLPQAGWHFWPSGTAGVLCGWAWQRIEHTERGATGIVDNVTCSRCKFLMASLGYAPI